MLGIGYIPKLIYTNQKQKLNFCIICSMEKVLEKLNYARTLPLSYLFILTGLIKIGINNASEGLKARPVCILKNNIQLLYEVQLDIVICR